MDCLKLGNPAAHVSKTIEYLTTENSYSFFKWESAKHCTHEQQIVGSMQGSCKLCVSCVLVPCTSIQLHTDKNFRLATTTLNEQNTVNE